MKRLTLLIFALSAYSGLSAGGDITFVDSGQRLGSAAGFSVEAQLGDIDNNGTVDAVVTSVFESFSMQSWINDGTGTFVLRQTMGTANRDEFALDDFDADGDLDIFVSGNVTKEVWLNDGSGFFTLSSSFETNEIQVRRILSADLDNDGDLDVFSSGQNVEVFINDGSANFSVLAQAPTGISSWSALGDLDDDGDLDAYLACNCINVEQILINDGSGNFTTSGQTLNNVSNWVALADFDQTTGIDAVVDDRGALVLMNNDGTGMLGESSRNTIGFIPSLDIAIGDLDSDGDTDLFAAGGADIAFFANDSFGSFSEEQRNSIPGFGSSALADLDGDGDLDAFVAIWRQGNQVWINETNVDPIATCGTAAGTRELPDNQWHMLGLPCDPPQGMNTVEALFGDDIEGEYAVDWIVYTYDPTITPPSSPYVDLGLTGVLEPGTGFWIMQLTGTAVTLDVPIASTYAQATVSAAEPECSGDEPCFLIPLANPKPSGISWNMVGNPFPATRTVAFNNLQLKVLGSGVCASGCSIPDARVQNLMREGFFHFDGIAYEPLVTDGATLQGWESYWVATLPDARDQFPILVWSWY